jgi:hypothetical protein
MKRRALFTLAIVAVVCFAGDTIATYLEITPVEDFEPFGVPGGPFTPSSKDYQLKNVGPNSLYWGADITEDWLDLYPWWGLLEPNESTIVTVSLTSEANSLPEGVYLETLTFLDITNEEEQTRDVNLTIAFPGGIWVDPNSFDANIIEGCTLTETLTVGNDGDEELSFTVQTRFSGGSEQSQARGGSEMAASKGGVFSVPKGRDFTVPANVPYKPGELLVRFASKADGKRRSQQEKFQILNSLGGATTKRNFKIVPDLSAVKLPPEMTVEEALQRFNKANGILYAQPNYQLKASSTFPNDPRFGELWGMHNIGQTGGTVDADIDAPQAWDVATDSSEIIVAVIDTGVDYTHPDLAANMWVNQAELNGNPDEDDDGNGYIDDIYGYDFYNDDGNPMDDHSHGTHCAGIIGAVGDNGEGVAGVCWNVRIMALKFMGSEGGGWTDDAISCIEYSVLMGANVSSNSYGGGGYEQAFKDAIDAAGTAGMLFVASTGNDDGQNNDIIPHYPSNYDCDSLIAVLSTDKYDNISSFSNYGPTSVDLGAPGSYILSCKLGGGYKYLSGTSMATPHVAGACALTLSKNPTLSNNEVKDIILQTVDETLPGLCVSEGRLNLHGAILQTTAPWLEIEPEYGVIGPGDSNYLSVTYNAIEMAPGTYEAEIVITSNDPYNPTEVIPVTMTVNPDDLVVTPAEDFEPNGTEGGPFTPKCTTYTLTNNGVAEVSWKTTEVEDWLEVDPDEGVLNSGESIDVNVCVTPDANELDPNIYIQILTFRNEDTNSIKRRWISLTVKPPDSFTQSFDTNDSDLEFLSLTFSPDGSVDYYQTCRDEVDEFPTDPNGGTYVPLGDDDFAEIILNGGKEIIFYGISYDRFYIGSNGYITFGQGDTQYLPSLENHFNMPRISALFDDLTPADNQSISYKLFDDRVVVTFEEVPLYGNKEAKNSFQIEMFFADGTICITWINLEATAPIIGLSQGNGIPVLFTESDLSENVPCWPLADFNRDYSVNLMDFAVFAKHWRDTNCGIPYWCEKTDLDFSGTTDWNDLAIFVENWLIKVDWWLQPLSHWKFDEDQGSMAYDSVGENHGTVYDANWTTGILDGALSFDGDADYVDLGDDDSLKPPLPVTLSTWIKLSGLGSYQYIIALDDPTLNYYGIWFYVRSENNLGINYGDGGGKGTGNRRTKTGTTELNADTWYHIAAIVKGPTDMNLCINGADDGGTYSGTGGSLTYSSGSSLIGMRYDFGYFFGGKIDDVRVYDRALSAEEIWQLYQEGLGGKAFNPNPADRATEVDPNTVLSWSPGTGAFSHNVYLGTDYNDVNNAITTDPNVYIGNQDANSYDPNGLDLETTYYWRIDEVGLLHTRKGDIWSFTTWSEFDPNLNLISWWKFDEGEGDTASDSAGENHGTVHDTNWTTGIINDALNFDGDGDYVDVGNDNSLKPPLPVTLSAWIKLSSLGNYQNIIALDDQTSRYYGIWFVVGVEDKLGITYGDGSTPGSGSRRSKAGTTALNADTWYYVTAVIRGPTDISLYINSVDDGGTYSGTGGSLTYSSGSSLIGMMHDFESSFDGKIDDVRVYDRALSDRDIWLLYQDGLN